jgi:hypothetical protein
VSRFLVHPLTSIVLHEDGAARELSAELETLIDSIWQSECADRVSPPVDGLIFNVTQFDPGQIVGHFVPYRRWIAQLRRPELRDALGVQPGSVCALSFARGSLLVGRRSDHVTQDPGAWEPVPAGGIAPEARGADGELSAAVQILMELQEEVNLSSAHVVAMAPFALVVDRETGVHDIAFELDLDVSIEQVEQSFRKREKLEVDALRAVERDRISDWIESERDALAPITPALLGARGLIGSEPTASRSWDWCQ